MPGILNNMFEPDDANDQQPIEPVTPGPTPEPVVGDDPNESSSDGTTAPDGSAAESMPGDPGYASDDGLA